MEPRQRSFIAGDDAYQVKSFGVLTDDDLHIFVNSDVLDGVLADAGQHVDKLRAGALVGGFYTDGKRRFAEIEGTVLLIEAKPPAQPFGLDETHHEALAAGIAKKFPGAVDLGFYFTHPRLGLYLSRSETAALKAHFDPTWAITLVADPVADKFSFFVLRDGAPVKSGFHIVTRTTPRPKVSPMGAPPKARGNAPSAPAVEPPPPPKPAPAPAPAPAPPPEARPLTAADSGIRARGESLTREELFRLATEEVFKDGQVDADENRTLQVLGGLLRIEAATAIRLAKAARKKFKNGELSGGRFDPLQLYHKAHKLAMADGELEADEANILASLRAILKLPLDTVTAGGTPKLPPPVSPPPARTLASSFTKLPIQTAAIEAAKSPPGPVPFEALLAEYAGIAFDRQVYALDRLGEHDFSWDLDAGTITLAGAAYRMQALGTTSDADQTWIWAWADTDRPLPPALVTDARKVQSFGKSKNITALITPVLPLASHDPNELAMVASGLTNSYLYYRIPFEGGALYVLINDPSFGRSPDAPATRIPSVFPRLLESVRVPPRRALIAYMRAFGLDVTEEANRVSGRQGADTVVATFDASGRLAGIALSGS